MDWLTVFIWALLVLLALYGSVPPFLPCAAQVVGVQLTQTLDSQSCPMPQVPQFRVPPQPSGEGWLERRGCQRMEQPV
jgi:hypothetical protein